MMRNKFFIWSGLKTTNKASLLTDPDGLGPGVPALPQQVPAADGVAVVGHGGVVLRAHVDGEHDLAAPRSHHVRCEEAGL